MKYIVTLSLWLFSIAAFSQNITPREVASLPSVLAESSGIEVSNFNLLWSHNDSGGQPVIYGFDTLGNISRTITLINAANMDWEDIAKDDQGSMYVGDFGNNNNSRQDLRIYKIPDPATFTGNSVSTSVINFSYADQKSFPPAEKERNFDMEAMLFYNDSLFIFSKNSTNPYKGYTKLYKLPAIAGNYTAAPVDSFYTGDNPLTSQITAAAISPDKKRMVLLSYGSIYCFSEFTGSNFFKGRVSRLNFMGLTQKEAIAFKDNCQVYITDENYLTTGGKLYVLDICPLTTGINYSSIDPSIHIQSVYPNPASQYAVVQCQIPLKAKYTELILYTSQGKQISRQQVSAGKQTIHIPVSFLPAGIYYCQLMSDDGISYPYKVSVIR